MSYVRGQVYTERGDLIASFAPGGDDPDLRAGPDGPPASGGSTALSSRPLGRVRDVSGDAVRGQSQSAVPPGARGRRYPVAGPGHPIPGSRTAGIPADW